MAAIDRLKTLVERFQAAKTNLQLENSSEATIRAWIDELLSIFGWDVQIPNRCRQNILLDAVKESGFME